MAAAVAGTKRRYDEIRDLQRPSSTGSTPEPIPQHRINDVTLNGVAERAHEEQLTAGEPGELQRCAGTEGVQRHAVLGLHGALFVILPTHKPAESVKVSIDIAILPQYTRTRWR